MDLSRRSFSVAMAATTAALMAGCSKEEIDAAVVADLKAAYNGEMNASQKYAFYAQKSREAGYLSIAAFFSAASFAEEIHAGAHAKVLNKYGHEATATIKLPEWVNVTEALKDAIKGETYEFTIMYPGFIKTATDKKMKAAIRSFTHALEAEKIHAKFYTAALANPEAWKAKGKTFYICEVCGFTTDDPTVNTCPYCAAPKSKFKKFD